MGKDVWYDYEADAFSIIEVDDAPPPLVFEYKNYKGETGIRHVIGAMITYDSSEYHNNGKPCFLLKAFDLDKNEFREFCVADIIRFITEEENNALN